MRTIVVTLLGVSLAAGSLRAEQPAYSLLEAARAEAARQAPSATTRPRMRPGFQWTGIALLGGGGALLLGGALHDGAQCPDDRRGHEVSCLEHDIKWATVATGGASVVAGGVVLLVGNAKRQPAPSVHFGRNRVSVRIRF